MGFLGCPSFGEFYPECVVGTFEFGFAARVGRRKECVVVAGAEGNACIRGRLEEVAQGLRGEKGALFFDCACAKVGAMSDALLGEVGRDGLLGIAHGKGSKGNHVERIGKLRGEMKRGGGCKDATKEENEDEAVHPWLKNECATANAKEVGAREKKEERREKERCWMELRGEETIKE